MKYLRFLCVLGTGALAGRCRPSQLPFDSFDGNSSDISISSGPDETPAVETGPADSTTTGYSGYEPPPVFPHSGPHTHSLPFLSSETTTRRTGGATGTLGQSASSESSPGTTLLPGNTPSNTPGSGISNNLSSTTSVGPGTDDGSQPPSMPSSGTLSVPSGSGGPSSPSGALSDGNSTTASTQPQLTSTQNTPGQSTDALSTPGSGDTTLPIGTLSVPVGSTPSSIGVSGTQSQSSATSSEVTSGKPGSTGTAATGETTETNSLPGQSSRTGFTSGQPGNTDIDTTPGGTQTGNTASRSSETGTASSGQPTDTGIADTIGVTTDVSPGATTGTGGTGSLPGGTSGTSSSGQSDDTEGTPTQDSTGSTGSTGVSQGVPTSESGPQGSTSATTAASGQTESNDSTTAQDSNAPSGSAGGTQTGPDQGSVTLTPDQPDSTGATITGTKSTSGLSIETNNSGSAATSVSSGQTSYTKTDSSGSTLTSVSSGNGPISTGPVTSTMTELPAGWSPTTISDHPEWTTNTWITTTSDGSSEPTIVPVLVGCPKCGGSGSGIVIFGWPRITGTLFSFPGFPKFSFPCIPLGCTIPPNTPGGEGGDDDGDDNDNSSRTDDDQSSTEEATTSTCTEEVTASDCLVACTTYTGQADTSANECTTWCTQTHTGCSATGITSTTEVEACGATGDGSCRSCGDGFASDDQDTGDDDDDSELLERRWSPTGEKEGNVGGCTNIKDIQFPEYPSGSDVFNWEAQIAAASPASPLAKVVRWYWSERVNCVFTLKGPTPKALYHPGQTPTGDRLPTIDHIYEKSFLRDYFWSIIDSSISNVRGTTGPDPVTKINCNDLEFYSDDGTGPVWLQKVFNTFPGAQRNPADHVHPTDAQFMNDLMGVDRYTNGQCKGFATDPNAVNTRTTSMDRPGIVVTRNSVWTNAQKWLDGKLEFLEKLALGVDLMNKAEAIEAMKRQNQRVWSRLQDMDDNARTCKHDSAVIDGVWSFAKTYQEYMKYRFDGGKSWSINDAIANAKTKILARIQTDIRNARRNKNRVSSEVSAWQRRYNDLNSRATWAVSITWDWTRVVKRQDDTSDGAACVLPTKTQTTSSASSSVVSSTQAASSQLGVTTSAEQTKSTATADATSTLPPTPSESCPADSLPPALLNGTGPYFNCRCLFGSTWTEITREQQQSSIESFCDGSTVALREDGVIPQTPHVFPVDDHQNVIIQLYSAVDQTGCQPLTGFDLGDYCRESLGIVASCNAAPSADVTYGGLFVDNGKYGCITWGISGTTF